MGQEKLALLLNSSRGTVNNKLKHFARGLKIEHRYVKIGEGLKTSEYHKERFKRQFKASRLKGYFIDHAGNLYRQIANKYIIENFEELFVFDDRKTFHYQNKRFNKNHSNQLDSSLPKEIIIKRDARRKGLNELRNKLLTTRTRKRIGVKENGILSSQHISNFIYKDGNLNFLYQKLQKEVMTVKKLGIKLYGRIDHQQFWLKNPLPIKCSNSFMSLTSEEWEFLQYSRISKEFESIANDRSFYSSRGERAISNKILVGRDLCVNN